MADLAPITGSLLHDLVKCERKVHHDLHSDPDLRDPVGEFVEMLWRGGREHEEKVLGALCGAIADLRDVPRPERLAATAAALSSGAETILGARIAADDLLGEPDILRRRDAGWIGGDVKSGSAFEQDGETPRREYAAQVAHYAVVLERLGLGDGNAAIVIGRDGAETIYDLRARRGRASNSIAEHAAALIEKGRAIRDGRHEALGAMSAACKMCCWHTICGRELENADDLTLLAGVGRSLRDALLPHAATVAELAALDTRPLIRTAGRTGVPGLGAGRFARLQARARLVVEGGAPYAREPLGLTRSARELHFDIEADPSRDGLVYLHGVLDVRRADGRETAEYVRFFAETEADEREAFAAAMDFLSADPSAMIYYYSKYERSSYRALQRRHPDVCSPEAIEQLFDPARAVDLLFDVIMPKTEWPLRNLSIKTIARHLGFDWRDEHASGAASIAWYDDYRRTGDPAIRDRIEIYNHDDVLASLAVLDGLIALPVMADERRG